MADSTTLYLSEKIMINTNVKYVFKDALSRTEFTKNHVQNPFMAKALDEGFYLREDGLSAYAHDHLDAFYSNGEHIMCIGRAGDSVQVCINPEERKYFMKDSNTQNLRNLEAFDKAVKSLREYRSERPFSKEDENLLDILRFAISVQK